MSRGWGRGLPSRGTVFRCFTTSAVAGCSSAVIPASATSVVEGLESTSPCCREAISGPVLISRRTVTSPVTRVWQARRAELSQPRAWATRASRCVRGRTCCTPSRIQTRRVGHRALPPHSRARGILWAIEVSRIVRLGSTTGTVLSSAAQRISAISTPGLLPSNSPAMRSQRNPGRSSCSASRTTSAGRRCGISNGCSPLDRDANRRPQNRGYLPTLRDR